MSELPHFDGEDQPNLYSRPDLSDTPGSYEEAFAQSRGGDPVEWIPEAEKIQQDIADATAQGYSTIMIAGKPETEGIFAGYYSINMPEVKFTDGQPELIVRTVYATYEQVAMGRFKIPKEGLFCIDPSTEG